MPPKVKINHSSQGAVVNASRAPVVLAATTSMVAGTVGLTSNPAPAALAVATTHVRPTTPGLGAFPDATTTGIAGVGLTISVLQATTQVRTTSLWEGGTVAGHVANVAGRTYRRVYFNGNVDVAALGVTFEECYFNGSGTSLAVEILSAASASTDAAGRPVFTDCTIDGNGTQGTNTGITYALGPHSFHAVRCDVSGGNDAVKGAGWVLMEDCYLHDAIRFSGAHADAFQNSGSDSRTTTILEHCTIEGPYRQTNAAVQSASTGGALVGMVIDNCLLSGGNIPVRIKQGSTGTNPVDCFLTNNVWVKGSFTLTPYDTDGPVTKTNNKYDDGEVIDP